MLEIESKVPCILGKHSPTELHSILHCLLTTASGREEKSFSYIQS